MKNVTLNFCLLGIVVINLISCSSDDSASNPKTQIKKSAVIENYANIVHANYKDAYDDVIKLQGVIKAFVENPTKTTFEAAKTAWINSRESYGTTEAFRFANGPIDDDDEPEIFINSWPLDENYIDYTESSTSGISNKGIINNLTEFPVIDKATLLNMNLKGGEKNVTVGYHAIEFLLWGQDNTKPNEKKAGQRPYTDFVDGGTATNQKRRRDYLTICADILTEHLLSLVDEWKTDGTYRKTFLGLDEKTALQNIFNGIGTLTSSELSNERMNTALDLADQEDEHSCFSDNTHRDIRLNFQGIKNVYIGTYKAINGSSLQDLINQTDETIGKKITQQIALTETAISDTAIPFDLAISEGKGSAEGKKILDAVLSLKNLGDDFTSAAKKLDIALNN